MASQQQRCNAIGEGHAPQHAPSKQFLPRSTWHVSITESVTRITAWKTSAKATLHCLTGCAIGEVAGLLIGVSLGIGVFWTITLAVVLAFVVGISLAVKPIIQDQEIGIGAALKIVWIGEIISISVMEITMNAVDLGIGGVDVPTVFTGIFWFGIAVAIPCGFIAAWPVNHLLLKKHLKSCH